MSAGSEAQCRFDTFVTLSVRADVMRKSSLGLSEPGIPLE